MRVNDIICSGKSARGHSHRMIRQRNEQTIKVEVFIIGVRHRRTPTCENEFLSFSTNMDLRVPA